MHFNRKCFSFVVNASFLYKVACNITKMFCLVYLACLTSIVTTRAAPVDKVMVDMSHTHDSNIPNPPFYDKFNLNIIEKGAEKFGVWVQIEEFSTGTHMGTHMDSPAHFTPGGLYIDEIPLSSLIAPAAVINIVQKVKEDPEAMVTVDDFKSWESKTGKTLNGTVVLVYTGWEVKWNNRAEFLGATEEDPSRLRFPGISGEASQWLVDNRNIIGVGIDTLSVDKGSSTEFPSHKILLNNGLYALENVANIDKIPIFGATLHVLPMKISESSGAPTRIIATFPKTTCD